MKQVLVKDCPAGPSLDVAVARALGWPVLNWDTPGLIPDSYPAVLWTHEQWHCLYIIRGPNAPSEPWSPSTDMAVWELLKDLDDTTMVRIVVSDSMMAN